MSPPQSRAVSRRPNPPDDRRNGNQAERLERRGDPDQLPQPRTEAPSAPAGGAFFVRVDLAAPGVMVVADFDQLDPDLASNDLRRACERIEGDVVSAWIEDTLELGSAGVHELGHRRFREVAFFHCSLQLKRDHPFDGDRVYLSTDAFLLQEV